MSTATTPETPETELTPELIERVMKLSPENRERLRALLGEPPIPELPAEGDWAYWKAEIQRRIEAVENGTMQTYTLEETLERIQKALDEGRTS
jgi:hypothetical protein